MLHHRNYVRKEIQKNNYELSDSLLVNFSHTLIENTLFLDSDEMNDMNLVQSADILLEKNYCGIKIKEID